MEYTAEYCARKVSDFETQKELSEQELKISATTETYTEVKNTLEINHGKRVKI